jgi:opacity protein-like surface antigen
MSSVRIVALAGAAAGMSTVAFAADFPPTLPSAQPVLQSAAESGWYLRGDIGITNQRLSTLTQRMDSTVLSSQQVGMGFDRSPFFLVGVGYQWNSWLRFDVTGEYRAKAKFHGSDNVTFFDGVGTAVLVDNFSASKSEWVVLSISAHGGVRPRSWAPVSASPATRSTAFAKAEAVFKAAVPSPRSLSATKA